MPYLIPIAWQATAMEPCKTIYAELEALEGESVPTLSFLPGFPAADFADCGATVVAYGATQADADRAADAVRPSDGERGRLQGPGLPARRGRARGDALATRATKPIVISDTQDNPGAGGDSDTMGMVHALVRNDAQRAAIGVIVDPAAAAAAHAAGVGATIRVSLGAKSRHPRRSAAGGRLRGRAALGWTLRRAWARSMGARA
jgi:microcystin degradation protein MlrC